MSEATATEWSPSSWRSKPIKQQPPYPEDVQEKLQTTLEQVRNLPPLVHPGEIDNLRKQVAEAGQGKMFILQGGDCAERFQDCRKMLIENKLRILLQMSLVMIWTGKTPVVRIIRGAGQFAKPRSSDNETLADGRVVPSYRGDNVNGFDEDSRKPDPSRLLQAYFHSAATLNYIRALVEGGFCSLLYPHKWDLDFVAAEDVRGEYKQLLAELEHGLGFLSTVKDQHLGKIFRTAEFFTSHEALIMGYEEAMTELDESDGQYFNSGAHFVWVGDRTRALDGAHIEYFSGIKNPIGMKCGPTLEPAELAKLVVRLNPKKEHGRIALITRYGADKVEDLLPKHIAAVQETGVPVTWISDPMHGNTYSTEEGLKTRNVDLISKEVELCFKCHAAAGTILGGIHLEMTGENVTECVGGSQELRSEELSQEYQTFCDPRLNYTQSLDLSFKLAKLLRGTDATKST